MELLEKNMGGRLLGHGRIIGIIRYLSMNAPLSQLIICLIIMHMYLVIACYQCGIPSLRWKIVYTEILYVSMDI